MPDWCWLLLGGLVGLTATIVAGYYWAVFHYRHKFLEQIVRIFEEKPFFIIPRGTPNADAEDTFAAKRDDDPKAESARTKRNVNLPKRGDAQRQLVGLPAGHLKESCGRAEHAGDGDEPARKATGQKTSKQGADRDADEEMRK